LKLKYSDALRPAARRIRRFVQRGVLVPSDNLRMPVV
jgi:hypothetical protein